MSHAVLLRCVLKIFLVIQSHLPPTYTRRTSALISVCLVLKSTLLVHWACSMALQQKTITQHQVQQKNLEEKSISVGCRKTEAKVIATANERKEKFFKEPMRTQSKKLDLGEANNKRLIGWEDSAGFPAQSHREGEQTQSLTVDHFRPTIDNCFDLYPEKEIRGTGLLLPSGLCADFRCGTISFSFYDISQLVTFFYLKRVAKCADFVQKRVTLWEPQKYRLSCLPDFSKVTQSKNRRRRRVKLSTKGSR